MNILVNLCIIFVNPADIGVNGVKRSIFDEPELVVNMIYKLS